MGYGAAIYRAEKTIAGTATDLTTENAEALALHRGVNRVELNIVDQPVRYTLDGTTPTATKGLQATAGSVISLRGQQQILAFKVIRESSSAEAEAEFFAD